jgi:mannose-6-phosphate isomerase-like protein (cupin superfamily)
MIPIFTRVKARSLAQFGEMVTHDGQEFIYVLQGRVTVHTAFYDPVTLSPGESVYIDSRMAHAYTAADDVGDALVICVCSTSQEELIGHAHRQAQSNVPIDQGTLQPPATPTAKTPSKRAAKPAAGPGPRAGRDTARNRVRAV